ncbi:MAG: hypothetical protein V4642_10620 [Bacteroidota bacterium]
MLISHIHFLERLAGLSTEKHIPGFFKGYNTMKKFFTALCLTAAFSLMSFAPEDQTYTWEYYKIEVTVPDDFKVSKNTDTEFDMEGDGMSLMMYVFEENIAKADMDDATIKAANEMKLQNINQATELSYNGFEGYFVEGTLDGERVTFAGLVNPKSHTNLFVAITFRDDDKNAEDAAFEILNTIKVVN